MKNTKKYKRKIAAAKSGMDTKTARKYSRLKKLPSELKKARTWKTHKNVFAEVWQEVEEFLSNTPCLQAKTVFEYLQAKYPGKFKDGQLRTLQRRFIDWRTMHGKPKNVIFTQKHQPGRQSQSDYTNMNNLNITIQGEHFKHLLFHFMLVYSRWEYIEICYTETFESLVKGYENAVWNLGCSAPEHRTDNLTAATKRYGSSRSFTEKWKQVMEHYKVQPSRNNPGESHENGSIEKSHDLLKTAIDQHVMLRGSREFNSIADYQNFIHKIIDDRNKARKKVLLVELSKLNSLPEDKWYTPKTIPVRVNPSSTINILGIPYSVPSRLISYSLNAEVYPEKIKLFYGNRLIQEMPRISEGFDINYMHIIDSLVRKPGAFQHYQYRAALFPSLLFKKTYDALCADSKNKGPKNYLKLLHMAKMYGEQNVEKGLQTLEKSGDIPSPAKIKELLNLPLTTPKVKVKQPNLADYDRLRKEDLC